MLILTPQDSSPPAVIGGYLARAEAEAAGELATAFDNTEEPFTRMPFYNHYSVIPGIGEAHQYGATHCRVERDWNNQSRLVRTIRRFGVRWPNGDDAGPVEIEVAPRA